MVINVIINMMMVMMTIIIQTILDEDIEFFFFLIPHSLLPCFNVSQWRGGEERERKRKIR